MANQPAPSTALTKTKDEFTGTHRAPDAVNRRLSYAAQNYNLVSPATSCGFVPEGFSIAVSLVHLDPDRDAYEVAGGLGLGKTALDLISNAAGVSWDPHHSRRTDDGLDPHYASWQAVGHVQDFDGRVRVMAATKEMDLREGGAQVEALRERFVVKKREWEAKGRQGKEPKDPEGQIREMRLHILAHAETKARLRAIRQLGIRGAYKPDEFKRAFCVVRLMATGESDDPELRRYFAMRKFDAANDASRLLYGPSTHEQPRMAMAMPSAPSFGGLPMPNIPMMGRGAPPLGASRVDDDDAIDVQHTPAQTQTSTATPPPSTQNTQPARSNEPTQKSGAQRPISGLAIKFGKGKGTPLEQASDKDLAWYSDVIAKSVDDPEKSRFKAANEKELAAIRAEIAWRAANGAGPAQPPPPPAFGDEVDRGNDPESW